MILISTILTISSQEWMTIHLQCQADQQILYDEVDELLIAQVADGVVDHHLVDEVVDDEIDFLADEVEDDEVEEVGNFDLYSHI